MAKISDQNGGDRSSYRTGCAPVSSKTTIWREHFAWSADYTLIVGLTPTGRATVKELQLNRVGLVNLGRVLFALGEHPPKESPTQAEQGLDESH